MLSHPCSGFVPVESLCPTGWWPRCPGLPKRRTPPPVRERPTHRLSSILGTSLPLLLCPGAYRGQRFTDPVSIWPGIWLTGCFSSVSLHHSYAGRIIFILYWPHDSAYATWGMICQSLTGQGYISYAKCCLHGLLFLISVGFYPKDSGLGFEVCTATGIDGERWRGLWDGKKGRKRGEAEQRWVEENGSSAGGSPQATSDIPLSDGLTRLPWHFFLLT